MRTARALRHLVGEGVGEPLHAVGSGDDVAVHVEVRVQLGEGQLAVALEEQRGRPSGDAGLSAARDRGRAEGVVARRGRAVGGRDGAG